MTACGGDDGDDCVGCDAADLVTDGDGGDAALADPGAGGADADVGLVDVIDADGSEGDAGAAPTPTRTSAQDGVDPMAWDPAGAPVAGQSRGGRARGPIFAGPEARCDSGDLVLANDHVRVCIAGAPSVSQFLYGGGHIIDMEPAGGGGGDQLDLVVPGVGLLASSADEIDLVRDGADGGAAVVRVRGIDLPPRVIGNLLGDLFPLTHVRFETEYRLAPDAPYLEVVTWVTRDGGNAARDIAAGDLWVPGDHVLAWTPGLGIAGEDTADEGADTGTLFVASARGASYGTYAASLRVRRPFGDLVDTDITTVRYHEGPLAADEELVLQRYMAAGRGGTVAIREAFSALAGAPDGERVAFRRAPREASSDPRYEIVGADGASVDLIAFDTAGEAHATLPSGRYTLRAVTPDPGEQAVDFEVPAAEPVAVERPPSGVLVFDITDESAEGRGASARVRFSGPVSGEYHAVLGAGRLALPPGTYDLEISRGYEYDLALREGVEVTDGADTPVAAALRRVWDTTGWSGGDMHQHQARSIDSTVPNADRVASNLVAGVDFMGPSDHDVIDDYAPIVADLGAADRLHVFSGLEISPAWGHINAFPMPYDRARSAGGAVPLSERTPGARAVRIFETNTLIELARDGGATVIQINHARGGSSALFDRAGYDPLIGPSGADPEFWPTDFDAMEILNDIDEFCRLAVDWLSLNSRGQRVVGTGNSDSHSLGDPAGHPRNYVYTGADDPGDLTDELLAGGFAAGAVTVSAGLFIDFPDGERPGDVIPVTAGEPHLLRVRVQSPVWSGVDELRVYIDGHERERVDLSASAPETVVDHDATVALEVVDDAHVVFMALARARMAAVTPGKEVFGVTNPIFLDVGGDGWTPPGIAGLDDVPVIRDIPFCP